MTRRALAIGCGGALGFAWTAVALRLLEQRLEWDARTADLLIGTSAGAEVVAALGTGRTPQQLLDALDAAEAVEPLEEDDGLAGRGGLSGPTLVDPVLAAHLTHHPGHLPPVPWPALPTVGLLREGLARRAPYTVGAALLPRGNGDASWLLAYGDALADAGSWTTHPGVRIVAADARTGRRVAFGAPEAPAASLGEAVAASWAIPGWFPQVRIGGRGYVDGGTVSSVSADLVLDLPEDERPDEVVIVAPMTSHGGARGRGWSRLERLLRAQMTHGLEREVRALKAAGIGVLRVEPGPQELAAMGANFMDVRRRRATIAAARKSLPSRIDTLARHRAYTAGRPLT